MNRREELEQARRSRVVVTEHPTIRFAVSKAGFAPVGECLICGHVMKLALWKDAPLADVTHGVCEACRDAAMHLRGPCSPERGCLCESLNKEGTMEPSLVGDGSCEPKAASEYARNTTRYMVPPLRDYEDWYGLQSLLLRLAEGVSDFSAAERAAANDYAERMFIDSDEAEVDA